MTNTKRGQHPSTPTCAFELVSPAMAKDWLENSNNHNRRLRKRMADKYARDMISGKWFLTHEAVAFDWNGELIDAQHRLQAIVDSKISRTVLVVRDLDPGVRLVVDTGGKRSPADVLKLIGYDTDQWEVAAIRVMMNGSGGRRATMPEIEEAYKTHIQAVKAVRAMFPSTKRKNIVVANVVGPIARAWYTQDRDRLQKFAIALYEGMVDKKEKGGKAVILLRDYLLQLPTIAGSCIYKEIYAKTETALNAYLKKEDLAKLTPTEEELFPLPGKEEKKPVVQKGKLRIAT